MFIVYNNQGFRICWVLLIALFAATVRAQPASPATPSEMASESLGKLRTLFAENQLDEAIKLLNTGLAAASPKSYDVALFSRIKAQVLIQKASYLEAAQALETALELGTQPGFFTAAELREQRYLLCQIYNQLANESKPGETGLKARYLDLAYQQLERWFKTTPDAPPDAHLLAASLLYGQATVDSSRINNDKLREAKAAATRGTYLQLKPKDSWYLWILAISQQLGEDLEVAETLELLVRNSPGNSTYWEQLFATYLGLSLAAADEALAEKYQLRAILTVERAHALGLLKTTAYQVNLVRLYLGLDRPREAIRLLEAGLADGNIENTRANWEILSAAYQESHAPGLAIDALKRATRSLPREGAIEGTLAQLLYDAGQLNEARDHLLRAIEKGNLDKPGATHVFLAYTAYELQDYSAAARWAKTAEALPDVRIDDLRRLQKAIAEGAQNQSGR